LNKTDYTLRDVNVQLRLLFIHHSQNTQHVSR